MDYWLVTLPNGAKQASETLEKTRLNVASRGKDFSTMFPVSMPRLPISSLDTLMSLSDSLLRTDREIEGVVAKIEKQYKETAGADRDALTVDTMPVKQFVERFEWNFAKLSVRADVKLEAITEEIRRSVSAADEEIRAMAADFNEAQQKLTSLKRKKNGGLASTPLEEFLSPQQVAAVEKVDSDYLVTLVVLVPKREEEKWLSSYEAMCPDLAGYGGPDWLDGGDFGLGTDESRSGNESERLRKKGSPVVPQSSQKVRVAPRTVRRES